MKMSKFGGLRAKSWVKIEAVEQWWATFLPSRAEKELGFIFITGCTHNSGKVHIISIHINFLPAGGLAGCIRIARRPVVRRLPTPTAEVKISQLFSKNEACELNFF